MHFHQSPTTYVGEVMIKVEDLQRSIEFYTNVIGFKVLEHTESKAVFSADGLTPLLTIEQPKGIQPKQQRTTGLYHFALLLPSRADLGSIIHHFIDKGVRLQGASDHLVSEALYLADPDGNGIEIYRDRPAGEWNWNGPEVEMASIALDVEELLKEGQATPWSGLPEATVMGHIHLHVSGLKDTEKFYTEGLGFEVVTRYGGQALFISTERYHHHIGLNTWNGVGAPAPAGNTVGLEWFSLMFSSEEKKLATVDRLTSLGSKVEWVDGYYYTYDPSGNKIKLV
ncbi:VOC family protein [Sutcliffiella horikoshii]|uniref:VOC family protein n=1 Tax=Sutcliffiella horikoshii TaxID=79883 RepID=UPI001F216875|nr:VOC family protein [Sutcliffiella horikoshii]MCG1022602.1 VOC family protein [Sutcliffiella horikoshii]